jgi:hypothetical protein
MKKWGVAKECYMSMDNGSGPTHTVSGAQLQPPGPANRTICDKHDKQIYYSIIRELNLLYSIRLSASMIPVRA